MKPQSVRKTIEIKSLTEDGSFTGLLSPYGVVDQVADMVMAGAFTKTITEQQFRIPLLWQHKDEEPIGWLELKDAADGLHVVGQLDLDTQKGRDAHSSILKRYVKGLSIGFKTLRFIIESGVRKIMEAKLFEGSIVTFPAALEAQIAEVKARRAAFRERKGLTDSDFDMMLAERQIYALGYQALSTLEDCLSSAWWNAGMEEDSYYSTKVDPTALVAWSGTIIDQFKATWMEGIAEYAGVLASDSPDERKSRVIAARADRISESRVIDVKAVPAAPQISTGRLLMELKTVTRELEALEVDVAGAPGSTTPAPAAEAPSAPEVKSHPLLSEIHNQFAGIRDLLKAS